MQILALVGRRYCGKSTVCNTLIQMDGRWQKASFGEALKCDYAEQIGVPDPSTWTAQLKEEHRKDIIEYSKHCKRTHGWDYFARRLFDSLEDGAEAYYVIDDLRFFEELALCLKHAAAVYTIHAEPHQRKQRGWQYDPTVDEDISETELAFSGYAFWQMTGGKGGTIFNTKSEPSYVRSQLFSILKAHFPWQEPCLKS